MAEALVSFLVEQLGSIFLQQVEQNVRLVVNVKKEVLDLTVNLETIQAVLADAERRQVKEANVRRWLNNLKEVSFEINDVVDEWSTEILKQQIEKQGENAVVPKKKKLLEASISSYLPSPYIGTSSLKNSSTCGTARPCAAHCKIIRIRSTTGISNFRFKHQEYSNSSWLSSSTNNTSQSYSYSLLQDVNLILEECESLFLSDERLSPINDSKRMDVIIRRSEDRMQ